VEDGDIPFDENDPIVRRCTLGKRKLRERAFKGFFKEEETKKILEKAHRYGRFQRQEAREPEERASRKMRFDAGGVGHLRVLFQLVPQ